MVSVSKGTAVIETIVGVVLIILALLQLAVRLIFSRGAADADENGVKQD